MCIISPFKEKIYKSRVLSFTLSFFTVWNILMLITPKMAPSGMDFSGEGYSLY